jgi:hypothetical protein
VFGMKVETIKILLLPKWEGGAIPIEIGSVE